MENSIFARFARAFFIFWHFVDVLVLSTTWNDLFCSCVDDENIWWQMFNFVFLCPKRWFQFNPRIVRTHFSSIMSLNDWKKIRETRSHISSDDVNSRFRRRRVCLRSLIILMMTKTDYDDVNGLLQGYSSSNFVEECSGPAKQILGVDAKSSLSPTCCARLAAMLHEVASYWVTLDEVWFPSNIVFNIMFCSQVWTTMLQSFGHRVQHCWTRARTWYGDNNMVRLWFLRILGRC